MLPQVVLSCLDGSPADRAGIQEGDELIEIDGESTRDFHKLSLYVSF